MSRAFRPHLLTYTYFTQLHLVPEMDFLKDCKPIKGISNLQSRKGVFIRRGEAEFHSAWTIHRSDPNHSDRRRMAWIVRYCPTGTKIIDGIRGAFTSEYPLIPVMGKGADDKNIYSRLESFSEAQHRESFYSPCFGNSDLIKLLKK